MILKVASYNIRKAIGQDRIRRPERILGVLAEIDADIVAVQEADRRFGARAAALPAALLDQHGYRAAPLGRRTESSGWHGNAILLRDTIDIVACGHIDLPTLEPRGAVLVDIAAPGGRLRVVGMHLDLSGLRRRQQARAILAALALRPPLPTILMGDLNEWSRARGCLAEFAAHFVFAATEPSFPARRPIARLDRIMVGAPLVIVESGTHHSAAARLASDHLPVWACIDDAAASR